jgi:hypothetical protein
VTNVNDIPIDGKKDAMGQEIRCFYGRKPPKYAVYRVDRRVMIHFADDSKEEEKQRKKLASLAPIRGEIDGLVDGWRDGSSHRFLGMDNKAKLRSKAIRYDRRVADALVVALEGDIAAAQVLLTKVKDDIVNERVAWARFEYLVAAFASALIVMFVAWILSTLYPAEGHPQPTSERMETIGIVILILMFVAGIVLHLPGLKPKPRRIGETNEEGKREQGGSHEDEAGWVLVRKTILGLLLFAIVAIPVFAILIHPSFTWAPVDPNYAFAIDLLQAAAAGAVGAFFSIALAIRGRTVLPDLQRTANLMDAVLRVTIGFIAGAVVMGLIRAGVVEFNFGNVVRNVDAVLPVLITGFIAGFSERLVPDLLDKAEFKTTDPSAPAPAAARAPVPARDEDGRQEPGGETPARPADEADPLPEEAADDACAADIDLNDDEVTADSDLPAATGGVARPEGGAQ